MPLVYVHLSDIHFGQERGGVVTTHDDVKERLLDDVTAVVADLPAGKATGVIVTGDIAYSGKEFEYRSAAGWLDRIAGAVGCRITDIQIVPGNHDINRDEISRATELMLMAIAQKGDRELDEFLADERDREMLYGRFSAYRRFAEAYNCSLDCQGGIASERVVELAPGRMLRFVGLNSALVCSKADKQGTLLLGERQRVLPVTAGQELIVLCHHPLSWLQDSEDARRYVRNRARVLISGHDHTPAASVEEIRAGCTLLSLAAGAAVPPAACGRYTYTYNVIEFDLEGSDQLGVRVHPRTWSENNKAFEPDETSLGVTEFVLSCPNFRRELPVGQGLESMASRETSQPVGAGSPPEVTATLGMREPETVPANYSLLLLRFFRDLSEAERLGILVRLGGLPPNWNEPLTHAMERRAFDSLSRSGHLDEVDTMITTILEDRTESDPSL